MDIKRLKEIAQFRILTLSDMEDLIQMLPEIIETMGRAEKILLDSGKENNVKQPQPQS